MRTAVETLRSELHADGKIHARYPTAERTLCGRVVGVQAGEGDLPDCGPCSKAARALDRIDGSMPVAWHERSAGRPKVGRLEAVAALQRLSRQLGHPPSSHDWKQADLKPAMSTMWRLFGTWPAALAAAGLIPEGREAA